MISRIKSSATILNTMSISVDSNEKGGPYLPSPKASVLSRFNKIFIGILLAGIFLTTIIIFQGPPQLKEHRRDPNNSYERLTVVMNTFKRPDELKGIFLNNIITLSVNELFLQRLLIITHNASLSNTYTSFGAKQNHLLQQ